MAEERTVRGASRDPGAAAKLQVDLGCTNRAARGNMFQKSNVNHFYIASQDTENTPWPK